MTHPLAPLALLAIAAPIAGGIGAPVPEPVIVGQMTIHERIIIRIPRLSSPADARSIPTPMPSRWKEKKGPKCIAAADLAGAMISEPGSVDLILTGGKRVRALLDDDCGPLDYYGGYYLRPASDGEICGGRDVLRMRSGGSCTIAKFRRLIAAN